MRTRNCFLLLSFSFFFYYAAAQQNPVAVQKQTASVEPWDAVRPFANGLAAVQAKGKWGFINQAGRVVVPVMYDAVTDFKKGEAMVCLADVCKQIDIKGQFVTAPTGFAPKKQTLTQVEKPVSALLTPQYSRTTSALPCPPNIDFENGNFTNWQTNTGNTSSVGTTNIINLPASTWLSNAGTPNRHTLKDRTLSLPTTDWYGGFPVNPVNGGRYSLLLGGDDNLGTCGTVACPNSRAEAARYVVNVPANATDYSITFSYAVVLENPLDGANLHRDYEQPRFTVKMYDPSTGEVIPCANFNFVASGPLPGFDTSKHKKSDDAVVRTKPWSSVYVNLSKYPGKTFYLEFTTADCTRGGHFGYAYVDVIECGIAAKAQTVCAASHITTLYGPPGFQSYQWYDSSFTSLLGAGQNVVLNPAPPVGTQYWVVTTPYLNTGCPTCDCRDTVKVILESNFPAASAGVDKNMCPGTSTTIGSAAVAGYSYQWWPTTGLANAGAATTSVSNITTAMQYILTVTDTLGCSVTDTVKVDVIPKPLIAFAVNNHGQCVVGNSFAFTNTSSNGGSGISYEWRFGDGATSSLKNPTHSYNTAGSYIVVLTATGSNGCSDSLPQQVVVHPTPVLTMTGGGNATICRGGSAALQVSGAASYTWSPAAELSCTACANPSARPPLSTKYFVEGASTFGCKQRDSVSITVIQPFDVRTVSDTLCVGDSIQLIASGAQNYTWSPPTGLSSTLTAAPMAAPNATTIYTVVGFDNYNCFTDTAQATVTVAQPPTVRLGPDLTLPTGSTVVLQSTTGNGPIISWLWAPRTALSCYTCPSPTADVKTDIAYRLTVINNFGCTATDTIAIKAFCAEGQVFIPNAFTPDGDGINDLFFVQGRGIAVVKTLRIFNRWGEVLFEKKNIAPNDTRQAWDGKIRGVQGPPDVFVYTAEVVCSNGSVFFYKGNVSVLK